MYLLRAPKALRRSWRADHHGPCARGNASGLRVTACGLAFGKLSQVTYHQVTDSPTGFVTSMSLLIARVNHSYCLLQCSQPVFSVGSKQSLDMSISMLQSLHTSVIFFIYPVLSFFLWYSLTLSTLDPYLSSHNSLCSSSEIVTRCLTRYLNPGINQLSVLEPC